MTGESESVKKEKSKDLLVSVIIPVYQVSNYVERCLLSVMNQTYKCIECIIVDDCSTDDSVAKIEGLIDSYEGPINFHILHHEHNRGLSAARNTGTDAAIGNYIYYLDSDDEISLDCIEKLVSYVINDDTIEMVQGSFLKTIDGKELLWKCDTKRILGNDEVRYQFLNKRAINYGVWNKLLKRSLVIDNHIYNKEGIINEDLLWTFYLIKRLSKAQLCSDITYLYHTRVGSIVSLSSVERKGKSYVAIFDEILNNLTIGKEKEELEGYRCTISMVLANYYRDVPELNTVVRLYKNQTKQYGSWSAYFVITIVAFISRFSNPMGILKILYGFKHINQLTNK